MPVEFVTYHVLSLIGSSSEDKDNLLKDLCYPVSTLLSDSLSEPVINGQIFINQENPHSNLHCL